MLLGIMPELPDITLYIEALEQRIAGTRLGAVRLASPFLLRTVDPPLATVSGKQVASLHRLGKRIVIGLEDDLWLVLHLMIAGRLHWREPVAELRGKFALAAFDFSPGSLVLTEAGSKKRASLHLHRGKKALAAHDPGGLEVLECDPAAFGAALVQGNHTLKRALTDPRLFSGIGNAYADEILHAARLSPVALAAKLSPAEIQRLHRATRETLTVWIERLRAESASAFPEKVTAFRKEMAVHGRYQKPCPNCATPVQRIRHANNETNYCPRCQTEGKLLNDRALARLLKNDWPRNVEELENLSKAVNK
jgi:formamidopyrimidine-DNA glycosylase